MADKKAIQEGLAGEIKRLKAKLEIFKEKKKKNKGSIKEANKKIKELEKKISMLNSQLNRTGDIKSRNFFEQDPIKKY